MTKSKGPMIYIGRKADGELVQHTNLDAMREIDGVTTVLKEIPLAEFEAAGSIVRFIDGKVVLGKTEAEKKAEEKQARVSEIDHELNELNLKQARSSAEIADALANAREPDAGSVEFHAKREGKAAELRKERAELLAS